MKNVLISFAVLASATACSFHARGPEDYKKDTRALLETREGQIRECYEGLLKGDRKLAGTVELKFTVKSETGEITEVVATEKGKASPELSQCVADAVVGLKLEPPDQRDGVATFTYEFAQK